MNKRRVVVTGASSGIGAATVRALLAEEWDVTGVARRADRLAALAEETGADVFVADLTSDSDVAALRSHLAARGPLHALVNNAGGAFGTDSVEASWVDDWARMFDINVLAVQRVTSALLPLLRQGAAEAVDGDVAHADILTVSSTAGLVSYEGGGGYNAAKFAVHGVIGALRLELAGEPIRVLEIAPGMVRTDEFTLNRVGGDQQRANSVYEGVEHPLVAEDIATVIAQTLGLPGHINLDLVVVRPVAQAAQHKVVREPLTPRN
ncbi:SDR family oxidoreductase [Salinibacterium hongtaonis]|uniref:Oxidoreductase n=1 Tax=Homoserinimonas hongtaonis TaxID=2079791 RepID=A0A2U1SX57_9MICO|nr:SDR family oxidoreductase [Salinibacterium hongtaonis]PWB96189.1 oxidoreductase [Salinibacterium hongtaonis]